MTPSPLSRPSFRCILALDIPFYNYGSVQALARFLLFSSQYLIFVVTTKSWTSFGTYREVCLRKIAKPACHRSMKLGINKKNKNGVLHADWNVIGIKRVDINKLAVMRNKRDDE